MGKLIADLIDTNTASRPIVVLDVGAGEGTTWLEFADLFAKDIEEKKLLLVVSNLETDFNIHIQERNPAVTTVNGNVDNLLQTTIDIGGKPVFLCSGIVDVINEHLSISAHSVVPDEDYLKLGQLLSSKGSMFLDFDFYDRYSSPEQNFTRKHRIIARAMGFDEVQRQYALHAVSIAEDGPHFGQKLTQPVLQKKDAPRISF